MHCRIIIWVVLAVFLSSCGNHTSSRQQLYIDKLFAELYDLKEDHPDSALILLNCLSDTMDEEALRRRSLSLYYEYQVLVAELCHKNLLPIRNDHVLKEAVAYYDSLKRNPIAVSRHYASAGFQYARALFLLSKMHEESGSMLDAFQGYVQAMESMDDLSGKCRFYSPFKYYDDYENLTALIFSRMATVLYTYDAWDAASDALLMSRHSYEKANNLKALAHNIELMGDIVLAQGGFLEANVYYHQADSIFELLQDIDVYHQYSSLIHRSLQLFALGDNDLAYSVLNHGLRNAESEWMIRQIHYAMGFFCLKVKELDSASLHYEKSYPLLPRQTTRSLSHIIQIANQQGNSEKAAYYGNLLADYELARMEMNDEKNKIISMYEEYKANKHDLQSEDTIYFILTMMILLMASLIAHGFWTYRRFQVHKSDIEKHEHDKAALEGRIRSSMDESQRQEEKIKTLEHELKKRVNNPDFHNLPIDTKMETLYEMPVCKRILSIREASIKSGVAYPEWQLTESQSQKLINAVDAVFPKFSIRIIDFYPRLRHSDVVYCCLFILGVSEIQAAALMGKSYQAVWKRSLKLHTIFQNKADLHHVLLDVLKYWKIE